MASNAKKKTTFAKMNRETKVREKREASILRKEQRRRDREAGVEIEHQVEDLDDVVARLRTHGAELVREIAQYEDLYRLCYVRGPGGAIVALAQELG